MLRRLSLLNRLSPNQTTLYRTIPLRPSRYAVYRVGGGVSLTVTEYSLC